MKKLVIQVFLCAHGRTGYTKTDFFSISQIKFFKNAQNVYVFVCLDQLKTQN